MANISIERTANNVIGVVVLTPRKRTKQVEGGGTAGIIPDINLNAFAYVRVVKRPEGLHPDTVKELDLENPERIYITRKENIGAGSLKITDPDIKGNIVLIEPHGLLALLSLESKEYFEEFGGTEPIII